MKLRGKSGGYEYTPHIGFGEPSDRELSRRVFSHSLKLGASDVSIEYPDDDARNDLRAHTASMESTIETDGDIAPTEIVSQPGSETKTEPCECECGCGCD